MPPKLYTIYMLYLNYKYGVINISLEEPKTIKYNEGLYCTVWQFGQLADLILFYYHMDNPLIMPTTTTENVFSFIKKYSTNTLYNRVKKRVRSLLKKYL